MNRAAAAACAACLLMVGCSAPPETLTPALLRFEFQEPQMGVPFRIVLYAPDAIVATNAASAAFERVAQLNSLLSDYEPESELSHLSHSSGKGRSISVGPDLWFLLVEAQQFARRSDGAFDITVGPAVNLWRRARRDREMPPPARLANARQTIGYEKVQLHSATKTAELLVPEMRLDLGGIAKGYAADQALTVLRTNGITRALVAAAGDIALGDAPPHQRGWRIEIPSLDATNTPPPLYVLVAQAGLSTSGDIFQRLEINGKRFSHIVDPRTGMGLTNSSLVTIIARNATTADALATAISVLGPKSGMPLVKEFPGASARILFPDKVGVKVTNSPGFNRFLVP